MALATLTPAEAGRLGGWFVILLVAPGLLVLLAVVTALLLRRRGPGDDAGPGYYHVLGFDKSSRQRREVTVHADSEGAARGRAEMEGVIATEVRRVHDSR